MCYIFYALCSYEIVIVSCITSSVYHLFLSFQSPEEQETDLPEALSQSSQVGRNSTKFGENVGFTVVMPEGESQAEGLSFPHMNVNNLKDILSQCLKH